MRSLISSARVCTPPPSFDVSSPMLLRPLITKLAAWGWTPNLVTALALGLSLVVGGLTVFARQNSLILLLLPMWLFLRMALNAIDGMMARELNLKSSLGEAQAQADEIVRAAEETARSLVEDGRVRNAQLVADAEDRLAQLRIERDAVAGYFESLRGFLSKAVTLDANET